MRMMRQSDGPLTIQCDGEDDGDDEDGITAALPSPPLPPLPPSLYIPPPVDRKDDLPESELPPRKRLCLSTLGPRYEIEESSTARPIGGRGIDYGFISAVDAKARRQGIRSWICIGILGHAELSEHDTQDLYALLEDAQEGRTRISQRVTIDSQRVDLLMEGQDSSSGDHTYSMRMRLYDSPRGLGTHAMDVRQTQHQVHETRFQMQQAKMAALRETDRRRQEQMAETLRVMRDMRREMSDMHAELLAQREQQRRARQPGLDARDPDHQETSTDADSHV
ncbi:hypothetical protein Tco_0497313 [Tanacetum coccineum]